VGDPDCHIVLDLLTKAVSQNILAYFIAAA
jgi:hypothetical protein